MTFDTLAVEYHARSRATQRLVGSRGDNIGKFERTADHSARNQTAEMSHVNEQYSINTITNLTESLVVQVTRICTVTCDDDFGTKQSEK